MNGMDLIGLSAIVPWDILRYITTWSSLKTFLHEFWNVWNILTSADVHTLDHLNCFLMEVWKSALATYCIPVTQDHLSL
jgi:hypothetical protein